MMELPVDAIELRRSVREFPRVYHVSHLDIVTPYVWQIHTLQEDGEDF